MQTPASRAAVPGPSPDELHYARFLAEPVFDGLMRRLAPVSLKPERVLLLGCPSDLEDVVSGRFPGAEIERVEPGQPQPDQTADLIIAHLTIACATDVSEILAAWRALLRHPGLLCFSTFGPATLACAEWQDLGRQPSLPAMAELGDLLAKAGYAYPVLDVDHLELTYADLTALRLDIRSGGARRLLPAMRKGLAGSRHPLRDRRAWAHDVDGRIRVPIELVFGHAWSPPPRAREDDDVAVVSLDRLRRRGSLVKKTIDDS